MPYGYVANETSVSQEKKMLLTAHPARLETLRPSILPALPGRRPNLIAIIAGWRERQRTRRHLGILDDRDLADVGLSRTQQRAECAKPFWQP